MINIGIVCPSDIALRRFLPALQKISDTVRFVAIGIASPEEWFGDISGVSTEQIDEQQSREYIKALAFTNQYGGNIIVGYDNLVTADSIDAVYIPLPPALQSLLPGCRLCLHPGILRQTLSRACCRGPGPHRSAERKHMDKSHSIIHDTEAGTGLQ